MRIFKILILFIALLSIASFKMEDANEMIIKKWKIDLNAFKKEFDKKVKELQPDKHEEAERLKDQRNTILNSMQTVTVEFKADSSCESAIGNEIKKGKWWISKDGKGLNIKYQDGKIETNVIKKLNKKKLIIGNDYDENSFLFSFIPA